MAGASGNLDITLTGADGTVTYTGAAFKPGVEVRTEGGIAPIVQAGNFSVTYQKDGGDPLPFSPGATNLTDAGRYAITVSGIGNYTGAYGEAGVRHFAEEFGGGRQRARHAAGCH